MRPYQKKDRMGILLFVGVLALCIVLTALKAAHDGMHMREAPLLG